MREYKALLDDHDIEALKVIVGQKIHGIYSKAIDIDVFSSRYISYFGYNIALSKDSFLVIKNLWQETSVYTDYWKLNIEFSHTPDGITFDEEKSAVINAPASFNFNRILVNSINIYSYTSSEPVDIYEYQTIIYDSAIVFNIDDNRRICFAPVKNIADAVWFTLDEEQITNYLKESVLRVTLSK